MHDERHQVDVRVRELRHEVGGDPSRGLPRVREFRDRRPLRGGRARAPCRARLEQRVRPAQHGGEAGTDPLRARRARASPLGGHEAQRHAVVAVQVRDMLGEDVGAVREHGGGRDGSGFALGRPRWRSRGSVPSVPNCVNRAHAFVPSERDLGDDAPRAFASRRSDVGIRSDVGETLGVRSRGRGDGDGVDPLDARGSPIESSDRIARLVASSPRDSSETSFVVPAARVSRVAGRNKTRGSREDAPGAPQAPRAGHRVLLSPACDRNSTCARLRSRKSSACRVSS